ncbi:MAG: hypothetical protein ACM3ZQ_04885 [Bacillota bacterium]
MMSKHVVRASMWADGGLGLYQLDSGEILSRDELAMAIMEGEVSGLHVQEDHGGLALVRNDGDDSGILDLLSPISEDDLQAWYEHNGRLPNWSHVQSVFTE